MTEVLYYTFVFQNQIGNLFLSYDNIKRILSVDLTDFTEDKNKMNAFYNLLNYGLIDSVAENKYSLTASTLFINPVTNIGLGVNLPDNIILKHKENLLQEKLGLTIFRLADSVLSSEGIETHQFNFNTHTNRFTDLKKMTSYWDNISEDQVHNFKSLEEYNFIKNQWCKCSTYSDGYSLYKIYPFNEYYYEYMFKLGNKYYKINLEEQEKVRMIILSNSNKGLLKYAENTGELILEPYFNYPNFFFKTVLLIHILSTGEFPEKRKFKIHKKQFLHIMKKLKLNYEIV